MTLDWPTSSTIVIIKYLSMSDQFAAKVAYNTLFSCIYFPFKDNYFPKTYAVGI